MLHSSLKKLLSTDNNFTRQGRILSTLVTTRDSDMDSLDPFPSMLEDVNQTGGKSELLLQKPTQKWHPKVNDTANIRLAKNDRFVVPPSSQQDTRKESHSINSLCRNGELKATPSKSTIKESAFRSYAIVFLRGECALRPTLIGNRVVVYEAVDQLENLLRPVVQCFIKNMEAEVPKELVKIG